MQTYDKKPYYITTAIAYASGKPHIGNCYEIVLTDAIARFRRAQGYDVFFQTGTDEHGQKIENKATDAGKTPKVFVDEVASQIRGIWDSLNISYDKFIRTTDDYHEAEVQKIFKKLYDQGDIYKGSYEGWYCVPDESFFTESQVVDKDGVKVCPDCGRPVTKASEEAYFFRMSKYADRLMAHIEAHPEFIQPVSRKNEMVNNFLKPGLQDLCVSRTSFKWGIPVSFDEKHVVYVWLDALTNYITGIGYHCGGESTEQYKKFWPADVHIIGKDIIRFHTIYWPIFLMALGEELPKQVFGHPWLLQGDGKMSKSRGNVLYADTLIDFFGLDAVRYFVLHEMPFENDGVITWDLLIERINTDLANTLGNLVNRTVAMSNKYFGGKIENTGVSEVVDEELIALAKETPGRCEKAMETLHVADALTEIWTLFKRCNKYIDETMPWALAKDPEKKDRLATVLYNLSESITIGASLLAPFLPETAQKIAAQLGASLKNFRELGEYALTDSFRMTEKPEILFARLDPAAVMKKVEEMASSRRPLPAAEGGHPLPLPGEGKEASSSRPHPAAEGGHPLPLPGEGKEIAHKPEVEYEDFEKLEFRVGKVLVCEEVPKSKKLLRFEIDFGGEKRQIVSGIKAWYKPEELVGKSVMAIVNLKPAKLAGLLSEGMLLSAEDEDGNLSLMTTAREVKAGAEIR